MRPPQIYAVVAWSRRIAATDLVKTSVTVYLARFSRGALSLIDADGLSVNLIAPGPAGWHVTPPRMSKKLGAARRFP